MGIIKRFASEDYVKSEIQTELEKIDLSTIEPKENDIPKIFIDGVIPTTKDEVLAELTYMSKTLQFHSYITIKCQGTSSMKYPKKNFTIKLYSDEARSEKLKIDFKGWGEQYKFNLKANWIDISHSRNVVSARLGCYRSNVGGTGRFAKGLLNDCKIYNYAISDTEMNEWLTASTL